MAIPHELSTYSVDGTRQVASVTTVVRLGQSNISRRSLTIYNASTSVLYVRFGDTVSSTNYKFQIASEGYYEMPTDMLYIGVISGTWAAANGFAYVAEGSD